MKKIISCFLALAVLLTFLPAPAAHAMPDTTGRLAEQVGVLQMLGVISGYPDGTFRPDACLTRAQFCKMAVVLLGKSEEIGLYKSYTIYPDVKSSHWAAGYINLSVKSLGLIKGFPDGTFRPETPITYAQAITILMRALGYADADVGLSWPAGYLSKAVSVGLTEGIAVSANASISRGSGAALFYNMLSVKTKSGTKFITTISGSVTENAVILDNNAKAADGSDGAVLLAGSQTAIKTLSPVPDAFVGLRGTLSLDSAGLVKTFLPGNFTRKSFVLTESVYPKLTASTGESYTLTSETPVYLDGKEYKYLAISYDLDPGTHITIAYTAAGAVDYVIAESSASTANTVVLTATPSQSALDSMLGANGGGTIYKNGTVSTAGDLKKYDVVSYDAGAHTYTVSDIRLSGAYEYAYPNTSAPTRITVLGTEFEVLSSAIPQLAKYKIGDALTFLFTDNMKVAGAVPQSELKTLAVGVYNGSGVGLPNGTTIKVGPSLGTFVAGTLVSVYAYKSGSGEFVEIKDTNPGVSIDMNAGTAGGKTITGNAAFYDKVGADGALRRISKSDISPAVISSANVLYLGYDSAGRVNLIVLNDITGDSYIYGKTYSEVKEGDGGIFGTITNKYAWVVNSAGQTSEYLCATVMGEQGDWGGIALDRNSKVIKYAALTKYTGLTRQSFTTGNGMMLGGLRAEIAEDVHIYVNATGKYMTAASGTTFDQLISDARAFGSSFEAYTDRDPSIGGKIRVIVIK